MPAPHLRSVGKPAIASLGVLSLSDRDEQTPIFQNNRGLKMGIAQRS
jgi:hypothetical protein